MTALHYAILDESSAVFSIVKQLLDNKADTTITNNQGHTIFHMATARNESKLLQLLLDHEHTKQYIDRHGKELVDIALQHNYFHSLHFLLKAGANSASLDKLSKNQFLQLLKKIREQGDTECFELCEYLIEECDRNNFLDKEMNILHFAAACRDVAMMLFFLEKRAQDINSRNAMGWTPLYYAIQMEGTAKSEKNTSFKFNGSNIIEEWSKS